MATYKLSYFNLRGLAETSRLVFAAAGEKYEDFRYPFRFEEGKNVEAHVWQADKPKKQFEKVPVLDVDGPGGKLELCQSRAIERFLAKRFNLFGSNEIEAATIDMLTEQLNDLRTGFFAARGKDEFAAKHNLPESARNHVKEFWSADDQGKHFFVLFERFLSRQANKDYFVGGKLSLFDIQFYAVASGFDAVKPLLESFPLSKAVVERVGNNPGIKAWVEKRPATVF